MIIINILSPEERSFQTCMRPENENGPWMSFDVINFTSKQIISYR